MPAYIRKDKGEILREALKKLQDNTPITAVGPGSVARALTEAVTTELGDMYDILDFNLNQSLLSSATGSALDLIGSLYNVQRKTLSTLAAIDKQAGAFYFYLTNTHPSSITIPRGTNVYTDTTSFIGTQFSYSVTEDVIIAAGRIRGYASIKPNFADSVFTAGPNTLVIHDFSSPAGTNVLCTNPKSIYPQAGYEDDEAYRLRIIKSIRVASSGTLEAVRFAGLSINGVRDIRVRQAPYGMGSFELIVVPEEDGSANQILNIVSSTVDSVRPLGVRMYIRRPVTKAVDVNVDLIIPAAEVTNIAEAATQRARVGIARYINSLLPGSALVYNRLIQIILDSSDIVRDVIVKSYSVSGVEVMRRNYQPKGDEQLIPGVITVNIAQS